MEWNRCHPVDGVSLRLRIACRTERKRIWTGRLCGPLGPAGFKAFLVKMGYEVRVEKPSKSHLTTRMVTSSLKPTPLQKSAALLKMSVMRPSVDREEPRRITPERRSVPNSSPCWFRAYVTPSVYKTITSPVLRTAVARSYISCG